MVVGACWLSLLVILDVSSRIWCDVMMSSISSNVATALDSTVPVSTSFTKVSSNLTTSSYREKESFIVVAPTLVASNIKILTSSSVLRIAISTGEVNSRAFLLKEGFKFFRSASGPTSSKTVYTLQETIGSHLMTLSNTQSFGTGTNADAAGDIVGTNNILLATASTAWTMDISTTLTALTATLPETTSAVLHAEFIPALNAFFLGKLQVETNLLAPTTLVATRRPALPAGKTARAYLCDNISPAMNLFVALNDAVVYKASWSASSVSLSFSGSFLSGASTFGTPTGMANLGAYQIMMVFVNRATAPTYVVVLDKFEMKPLDTSSLTIPGLTFVSGTATGMISMDHNTFLWGQIYSAASVFNFHTYQLRVDPCILRNYFGVCTTCIKPTILIGNTSSNICNFSTSVPDGWGIDSATSMASKCKDANCLLCGQDFSVCTSCDASKGVKLVNGTCQSPVSMGAYFVPTSMYSTAPYTSCGGIVIWLKNETAITLPPSLSNSFLNTEDDAFRPPKLTLQLKNSLGKVQNFTDYTVRALSQSQFLLLELSCKSLPYDTYKLVVDPAEPSKTYIIDTVSYNVVFDKIEFDMGQVGELTESDPSGLVWVGTYGLSSIDQPTSTSIGFVALALDPTGTFFRFTKILQIVNKLYFININYGKRLEAFLAKCKIALQNTYDNTELVYHSANFRGRLNQGKSGISLLSVSRAMITFYLLSWALQIIKRFMLDHCAMGRVGIYFCHYANKVHLIVFNLVFVDFLWLAPRTLLHSRDLSRLETNGAILVLCLVGLDLYMILVHLLDARMWRKALEHLSLQAEYKPLASEQQDRPRPQHANNPASGQQENNSMLLNNTRGLDETFNGLTAPALEYQTNNAEIDFEKEGHWRETMKQINYKKTYFEIDFNVHLMDMATFHLRMAEPQTPDKSASPSAKSALATPHWSQESLLCRLLVVYPWLRASLLQITIQNTQYAVFSGIWVLFALELARLFATIYAYLKYKYLKNIICLLMEVLPSGLLSLFFVIALLISPKRFDEPVIDFYQDAGIWIVIASCVAEYLLLITYITVAAYEFIKNRNMMKKMKVKPRVYSLFKFDDLRPWLLGQARPFEYPHPLDPESPEKLAPMSVVADANLSRQGEVDSIDMRVKPIQRRMQQVQVNAVMPISNTSAQKTRDNMNKELSKLSEMNRGNQMPRSMMGKSREPAEIQTQNPQPIPNSSTPSRRNGGSPAPESASGRRSPPPNLVQQDRQMRYNQYQQQQTEVTQNPDLSRLQTNQNDTTQDPLRAQMTAGSLNQSLPTHQPQNRGRITTLASQQTDLSGAANPADESLMTRPGGNRVLQTSMTTSHQQQVRANPEQPVNAGNTSVVRGHLVDNRQPVLQNVSRPVQPPQAQQVQQVQQQPPRDRPSEAAGGSSPNLQNSRGYLVPIKPSNIPTLTNFTPGQGIMDYATMLRHPNQVMIPGFGRDDRAFDARSGQYELGSGVPLGKDESSSHGGVKELPQQHPLGLEGKPVLPPEFSHPPSRLPNNDQRNNSPQPFQYEPNKIGSQQTQNPQERVPNNTANINPVVNPVGVRMPPPRQRSPQPNTNVQRPNAYPPSSVQPQSHQQPYGQPALGYQSGQQIPATRPQLNQQQAHAPYDQRSPVSGTQNLRNFQPQAQRPQLQNPQQYTPQQQGNLYPSGPVNQARTHYGSPPPQRISSPQPNRLMHSSNSPRRRPEPAGLLMNGQRPIQQGQPGPSQQQFRSDVNQPGIQVERQTNQIPGSHQPGLHVPHSTQNPPRVPGQERTNPTPAQGHHPRTHPSDVFGANQGQRSPGAYQTSGTQQPPRGPSDQRSPPPGQRVDSRYDMNQIQSMPQRIPGGQPGYATPNQQIQQQRSVSNQPQNYQPPRQSSPPPGQQPPQSRMQPPSHPQPHPNQQRQLSQQQPPQYQNPRQPAPPQPLSNQAPQQQPYQQPQARSLPPGPRPTPPGAPQQYQQPPMQQRQRPQPQQYQQPPPQQPQLQQPGAGFVLPPHPRQRSPAPAALNYTLHPIKEAPVRPAGSRSPPPQERTGFAPQQGPAFGAQHLPGQIAPNQGRMASPPPQMRQGASPVPQGRMASPPPQMRHELTNQQIVQPPHAGPPRNRQGSPQPQPINLQPPQSRSPPPRQQ